MKRVCGHLWERSDIKTLALLPRIRLHTGGGIGLGWLTAWLHIWVLKSPWGGHMIELTPHVWLHWHSRWGAGIHVEWIVWRTHFWFYRPPSQVKAND